MSRASERQHPNPTADELADHVAKLPRQLGVWRAGQHGLYHLLVSSSLARIADIARAHLDADPLAAVEASEAWRHATCALVDWHARWARSGAREPGSQAVNVAIRRARDWRALEVIQHGLRSGDMHIADSSGWDIRLANTRSHAVEVLDIVLQQVSIPAPAQMTGPSAQPVHRWFTERAGQPEHARYMPKWVRSVMYQRALSDLLNRDLTMPPSTDVGGLPLADARACYAFLLARAELAVLCTTVLGSKETAVWYAEPGELFHALADLVGNESAAAFIRLCTYGPGRSPVSAPLIPDDSLVAIPAALISPVGFERALLRAAAADPGRGGNLGNALGHRSARWADRLRTIPGALVAERLQVTNSSGQAIGDLDLVAFDPVDNLLFIVDTKWPVDAYTLQESSKVDDAVDAGRRQLLRIRTALDAGGGARWPIGWQVTRSTRTRWWVGTAQQLSTRPSRDDQGITATSLRLIEHLLPASSISDLQERLENFPLPRIGVEYDVIDETVRAGRYHITIPAIAILGDPPMPPEDRRTNRGWT